MEGIQGREVRARKNMEALPQENVVSPEVTYCQLGRSSKITPSYPVGIGESEAEEGGMYPGSYRAWYRAQLQLRLPRVSQGVWCVSRLSWG